MDADNQAEFAPPPDSEGVGFDDLHPFIQGLLKTLPKPESEWDATARMKWLQTAAGIFDLLYKGTGEIEITYYREDQAQPEDD